MMIHAFTSSCPPPQIINNTNRLGRTSAIVLLSWRKTCAHAPEWVDSFLTCTPTTCVCERERENVCVCVKMSENENGLMKKKKKRKGEKSPWDFFFKNEIDFIVRWQNKLLRMAFCWNIDLGISGGIAQLDPWSSFIFAHISLWSDGISRRTWTWEANEDRCMEMTFLSTVSFFSSWWMSGKKQWDLLRQDQEKIRGSTRRNVAAFGFVLLTHELLSPFGWEIRDWPHFKTKYERLWEAAFCFQPNHPSLSVQRQRADNAFHDFCFAYNGWWPQAWGLSLQAVGL